MSEVAPFKLTIRVSWWMQSIQMTFGLIFTISSFIMLKSFLQGSMESLGFIFPSVFLAYMGWANALSTIQITDESVTVTVFYGRFRINWNEVGKMVLNAPYIALLGNEKRVMPSLAFAGRNSRKMLEFFNQPIEVRKIVFDKNISPFPLAHKNARVWK